MNFFSSMLSKKKLGEIIAISARENTEIEKADKFLTLSPYNVSKEYDKDLSLEEYLAMLIRVFSETYRVLVNGGRACINVANLGRKPYIPVFDINL